MTSKQEQVQAAIADQASEWFVKNDESTLSPQESAALASWLKASPAHIEEFLGVSVIARDLRSVGVDPEYSLETLIARAHAENDSVVGFWPLLRGRRDHATRGWRAATWATAALAAVACVGLALLWRAKPDTPVPPVEAAIQSFETRHGELQAHHLADDSVLHMNTDTSVIARYSAAERQVTLVAGQVFFEVAHEPRRPFRVVAGPAEVVALGTQFDVRVEDSSAVVTVVEGRISVAPSGTVQKPRGDTRESRGSQSVEVRAGQQISISSGKWPAAPNQVDTRLVTAWLHRQVVFEREPLERVAAEFNRYAPKPIDITAPELRQLEISGVFITDKPEAFIAFLRTLPGVRVEVTPTRIVVTK